MVVQQAHAALVVGVGLGLVGEHRRRPALGRRLHRLGVPVRALDQAHGDRDGTERRPGDDAGQVVDRILQVGLDDDAGVQRGKPGSSSSSREQPQRQVLDVVVLHVEVHERATFGRGGEDRPQSRLGLCDPEIGRERRVQRGQRGRFDADVGARQRADVVTVEVVVGRPVRRSRRAVPSGVRRRAPRTGRPPPR